ncbi:hypothetical protein CNYM01_01175 [Colletotrichum nymphaeae SA-01]|uniref:Uncharacterized protein n=1 Tax=Colletotrichum nymphaeae SA-01 TaxID=1460502 RepID=A0A135TZ44_9PEZI|nr:hypothetical protein CNYM01_01175 [Colletotrichum nymphaeae SA-01]
MARLDKQRVEIAFSRRHLSSDAANQQSERIAIAQDFTTAPSSPSRSALPNCGLEYLTSSRPRRDPVASNLLQWSGYSPMAGGRQSKTAARTAPPVGRLPFPVIISWHQCARLLRLPPNLTGHSTVRGPSKMQRAH